MKKFFYKAKNILNNENAGPNVEQIVGIGISILVLIGLIAFSRAVFAFAHEASRFVLFYQD